MKKLQGNVTKKDRESFRMATDLEEALQLVAELTAELQQVKTALLDKSTEALVVRELLPSSVPGLEPDMLCSAAGVQASRGPEGEAAASGRRDTTHHERGKPPAAGAGRPKGWCQELHRLPISKPAAGGYI